MSAHPNCHGPEGHVCQKVSGRACIEPGCNDPAGTLWGPHWCPAHDERRLNNVSRGLDEIAASFQPRHRCPDPGPHTGPHDPDCQWADDNKDDR